MFERDAFSQEILESQKMQLEQEIPDTQLSFETLEERRKRILEMYGRAQLDAIDRYYLTKKQKEQVLNEGGRRANEAAKKMGYGEAVREWKKIGDKNMYRMIIRDFLIDGKIKTDNGIPIPLQKFGAGDLDDYKRNIDSYIAQYCDSMEKSLGVFVGDMKDVEDRDLTLKGLPTIQSTFDEVASDFKGSFGSTLLGIAKWGMSFIPIPGPAKDIMMGVANEATRWVKKKEELAKQSPAQRKEEMRINLKDRIAQFNTTFLHQIQTARFDIEREKNSILSRLIREYKEAKGRNQQKIKNGVIFSLQSFTIQAEDLNTKDILYFKTLLCAAWINSINDTEPDKELRPPTQIIQPGHLKIEFAFLPGNLKEMGIPSKKDKDQIKPPVVTTNVATEIRALGARQLKVALDPILAKPRWFLPTAFKLPVPKTIYFSQYNPKYADKGGIHNYIRLDRRNRIVDFYSKDQQLVSFVKGIMHERVLTQTRIKNNADFVDYTKKHPDVELVLSLYWNQYFKEITFPE